MRDVIILGVGMTKFGKFLDVSISDLGLKASWAAIQDSRIDPRRIQSVYCGHVYQGPVAGQRVMAKLGITGIPVINVENFCCSGASALREAWIYVGAGVYDVVMVLGMEKLYGKIQGTIVPDEEDLEGDLGLTTPSIYALRARVHMKEFGTTRKQLALISVKNHRNGCLNPNAQYQKEVTVEEVLASRPIAEPLNLLDCCPIGDGAAAIILCSADVAKQYTTKPIKLAASTLVSGTLQSGYLNLAFEDINWRAGQEAYNIAGVGPEDIDFAEVHDCFTLAEILRVEGLGICKPGEYGPLLEKGYWDIGGKLPINPSGGLLAKGHPLGATGVAQVCELNWQLRGQAGQRTVEGAKVGLAHCRGGTVANTDGGACTVQIVVS